MNLELISIALGVYGLAETPGAKDNPEIIQMAKDCGFGSDYQHDSIAWCSLLMNWVAWKAGYERSKSLAARSWLTVGQPVNTPEEADVAVLWRDDPTGPFGHVGMPILKRVGSLYLLAGNQGNMVNIAPAVAARVLGYRRLSKVA